MSEGYWTEKDKKPLPPSPTLLEPWPSKEGENDKEEKDNDNKAVAGGKI